MWWRERERTKFKGKCLDLEDVKSRGIASTIDIVFTPLMHQSHLFRCHSSIISKTPLCNHFAPQLQFWHCIDSAVYEAGWIVADRCPLADECVSYPGSDFILFYLIGICWHAIELLKMSIDTRLGMTCTPKRSSLCFRFDNVNCARDGPKPKEP